MGRWFSNQGWNRNLLAQLSGGPVSYQIDVYVVARFLFFYSPGASNWTVPETESWKRRFANRVYETWSEQWRLLSDISCDPFDVDRSLSSQPTARVRVHAVDEQAPSVALPPGQRIYAINVYRRAPGEPAERQHAEGMLPSLGTVGAAAGSALPSGTSEASLYEDALELGAASDDGNRQVVAMHEFGHMLGLMHPNDMREECEMDRSAPICYGQVYSPESASIMGRGQAVRRDDYRIFEHIISRLVVEVPSAGLLGGLGMSSESLQWFVEGSTSVWCDGHYELSASLGRRSTFTRGVARRRGPTGVA
ncbi:MAG: hypothetical protein WEF50_03955 [Myxococcota bacterium]